MAKSSALTDSFILEIVANTGSWRSHDEYSYRMRKCANYHFAASCWSLGLYAVHIDILAFQHDQGAILSDTSCIGPESPTRTFAADKPDFLFSSENTSPNSSICIFSEKACSTRDTRLFSHGAFLSEAVRTNLQPP